MAIDATKYQLTHLLQDAWYRMGQLKRWKATGGTQTTVVNTTWAGVEEQIFEDDDPALIYGTLVVLKDTAGAAPEGEMALITDYDSSSQTLTMDSLSAAVASGDRIGIASPLFPFEDMIELANIALRKLGDIDIVDTSLSIVANQTEYTLPTAFNKRPVRVRRQTSQTASNNQWELVQGWDVIPATAGSQWTLVVPHLSQGYSLEVMYRDAHPELTAFDSYILDAIAPELAVCAVVAEAFQWYNNQLGGSNEYFLQRENKAIQDLESAMVRHFTPKTPEQVQGLPHWGIRGDYVPGTSDLRG